jgi:hypothetical protein
MEVGVLLPVTMLYTKLAMKSTTKRTAINFAIDAKVPARPPKPKIAAITARIKKVIIQLSIGFSFSPVV